MIFVNGNRVQKKIRERGAERIDLHNTREKKTAVWLRIAVSKAAGHVEGQRPE